MKFVDRIEESKRLKSALSSGSSKLIVIYGRRRLGKSTLIKKVLTDRDIYYLADTSEAVNQRYLLSKMVSEIFPGFDKVVYPDWETLLRSISYRATSSFTLCLDEFPFLVNQSPELPSVIQKLTDEKFLKYNIIICGSSQNMMYGLCLDASSPLYGRADAIIKLTPIKLPWISEALNLGAVSAIEEYAVWGGVPRYWELRENCNSLSDALYTNVLSDNGILYEEPLKLFQDDVKDIVKTYTLMTFIGNGANRLTEIASRSNEPATNLSRPLKKLIDLSFLEKEIPFGINEKLSKKSLYKISDPFMAFFFKFVVPNRSFIELERLQPVKLCLDKHFNEFVSVRWEKLCRDAVTGNTIGGILFGVAKRWWGSVRNERNEIEQIEFDVVAESINKKCLLVGECKWTNCENGKLLTAELVRKAKLLPFASSYNIMPVLFLKNKPVNDIGNALFPDDILNLMK